MGVYWASDNFFVTNGQKRDYLSCAFRALLREGATKKGVSAHLHSASKHSHCADDCSSTRLNIDVIRKIMANPSNSASRLPYPIEDFNSIS